MKVYVESLPDGDADIFPDQVFIVTNKVSEEVTDEQGNTYLRKSYEVINTMSRVEWDRLSDMRLRGVTETSAEHDELFALMIEGEL